MTLHKLPKLLVVAAVTLTSSLMAAPPTIGVASAVGTFSVNSSEVQGNANLFDGSHIRTDKASSKVYLMNGAALVLGVDSAGTIYQDHFTLDQGALKVENLTNFAIRAEHYEIRQDKPSTQALVRFTGGKIEVAALTGSVAVFDGGGTMLTRITAGTASSFQSGLSTLPSGASTDTNGHKRRVAFIVLTAAALTGLGLATDAIVQSTSP